MKHLKRNNAPKAWPIKRKGTKLVLKSDSKGLPVLIAIRDVLKIAKNRSEVKKAIHKKEILLCNKPVKGEKEMLRIFDTLTIVPSKKNYKLILSEFGKFDLEEIKDSEKSKKISKIDDKKILKKKKTQLNLFDGRNFLTELKCKVNDSVLIDFEKNKIEKCIPFKENSNVFVIGGKHAGKKGVIKKIDNKLKMAEIEVNKISYHILIKQLMVTE
ncbi:MAG: KOW motif-containing protein [Candidatus Pacearchaeota archaeon]|jgi:small subunit ribosomal protein S4e